MSSATQSVSDDLEKRQSHSGSSKDAATAREQFASDGTVHRALKARHVQMIALGGTIGTGLFVGVGSALHAAGPVGLWLGYSIMGGLVWSMMVGLGEMTTFFPVSGAFTHYASRFVDPALGFALGWTYWYCWAIAIATESVAAALLIQYWPGGQTVSPAVFITVFLVVIAGTNFLSVRIYGEAEFWLSLCKIVTLLGLIILGIVITAGGGPTHETTGFRYWREIPFQQENGIPGSLGRFLAFWTVFLQATFSFTGTELVAITAAEASNPRDTVPRAIKGVFYRIVFFYVAGTFVLGLLVSPDNDQLVNGSGTSASPWVIAIEEAGIKGLPSVVNAAVLLSAWSAGESDLYAASRTLYGLAIDGKAPKILKKCTASGIPIWATLVTWCIGLLSYLNVSNSASTVFTWLSNLSAITGLISWACIMLSYIRFYHGLRVQGIDRNTLPYKAPLQPYATYFGFVTLLLIILFNGYSVFLSGNWNVSNFIVAYISLPIFFACYFGWKLWKRTSIVPLADIDFCTGRRELDEMMEEEADRAEAKESKNVVAKIWRAIM